MALDKQSATARACQLGHFLESVLLVLLGIGADQRDRFVTQVARSPDRTKFRVREVRAAAGMGNLAHIDDGRQLVFFQVKNRNLVAVIGRHHEVTLGGIQTAVVQERCRTDFGHLQCLQVRVIHHQGLAGLLDVHDKLRLEVATHNRGHTGLRVVFLRAHHVAAGRDDLEGLQRVAIHDDELGRPVGSGNRVLVFKALELAALDRTRFKARADFSHGVGLFHPHVNHVHLGVAANHEQVAARGRHARDVHGIASLENADDFLRVTIDQRNLTRIAQRGREDVADVVVVHLLLRTLIRRNHNFPRLLHVCHAEFRRDRGVLLHVACHQIHIGFGHFTGGLPVRHASG